MCTHFSGLNQIYKNEKKNKLSGNNQKQQITKYRKKCLKNKRQKK